MALEKRISKLEAQTLAADGVKTITRIIVWANGERLAYIGRALTPNGWQTITAGADTTDAKFENCLCAMAEGCAT